MNKKRFKKKHLLILPVAILLMGNAVLNSQSAFKEIETETPAATAQVKKTAAVPVSVHTPAPSPTPSPSPTPDPEELERQLGQQIADFALGYWGCEYQYGGETAAEGFDCSGLVYHVYGHFGYPMERVSSEQAKQGTEVSPEEMRPGDILCFKTSGSYVGHVGLYVGENCYIHAMGEAYGVLVTSLDNPDLERDFTVRRIIGCEEMEALRQDHPVA